nr:16S rRNA (adenine(1518)-N(6)/adenine(1519)-N(6))-dimethyltransferase RsmA [Rhabdothermincola sediminis]
MARGPGRHGAVPVPPGGQGPLGWRLLSRRRIGELLTTHGLRPSRALGQNFVADPNTVRRIARLAEVGEDDAVVEIGAGLGSLTLALAETGASVTAVEVDRHLLPVLREQVEAAGVRVVEGDARTLDWKRVLARRERWVLVANLPYNVATPLVLDLLDQVPQIQRMLVMVQREAGERLVAGPGDEAYGVPSLKVAYHAEAAIVGRVPSTVFVPQPRVESVLVRIVRRPRPAVESGPDLLFSLVRQAFGQRRKMLRRSLAGRVPADAFARAGIDPEARPEQLGIEAWGRLADAVAALG